MLFFFISLHDQIVDQRMLPAAPFQLPNPTLILPVKIIPLFNGQHHYHPWKTAVQCGQNLVSFHIFSCDELSNAISRSFTTYALHWFKSLPTDVVSNLNTIDGVQQLLILADNQFVHTHTSAAPAR